MSDPSSVSVEPGPLPVSVAPDNDELSADTDDAEFFLRSLADIEREHAAGDLDDDDYQRLRDAYTVRAAAALRHTPVATGAARPSKRGWAVGTGVLAVAVIAGVLLARGSGERLPGQTITGDIPALAQRPVIVPKGCPADLERPKPPKAVPVNPRQAEIDKLLSQGAAGLGGDLLSSLKAFDSVTKIEPDNVIALTYGGWIRRLVVAQGGPKEFLDSAELLLGKAIAADPTYPDARAFRGVLLLRDRNQPKAALVDLCTLILLDPPDQVRQLAQSALDDAIAATAK